jgi:O-antigen ligase
MLENKDIYRKIILINLKLLILLAPLVLYKKVEFFLANQEAWLKLFVIIGASLCLLKIIRDKKFIFLKNELNLPILFFFLIISISVIMSEHLVVSLKEYMIFISYFLIYFIIINNIKNQEEFSGFIRLFFITSFLVSIYTLLHYYGLIPYLKEFGPVISTIGQKNATSTYLALIFPLLFSYFLLEKNINTKIFYYIILSIIYATLMICQSRGIWISIGLTLIIGIFFIFKFKLFEIFKKNQKLLISLCFIFLIITIIYSTDNPLNRSAITVPERAISTFDEKDPSINTRFLMWNTSLNMIKDKPIFGSGIGTFKINYLDYQAEFLNDNPGYVKYWVHAREPHNEYLHICAELGIIGLGIFLIILFLFYNLAINYLKKSYNTKNKIIAFGLLLGITCFLIHNLFSIPLHIPALGSALTIILSLSIIYIKDFKFSIFKEKQNKKELKYGKLQILFSTIILVIAIMAIDSLVVKPYISEIYFYKGRKNLLEGNHEQALSNFEYVEKLDPYNGKLLLYLGATYFKLGNYERVEELLNKSRRYHNDENINRFLGLYYMEMGQYQKAEKEFKYAIYLRPEFIEAYYNLGYLYFIQK